MSRIVTWPMVAPKIANEMAGIKEALTMCAPADLTRLQGRYAALETVTNWFNQAAIDEPIFEPAP